MNIFDNLESTLMLGLKKLCIYIPDFPIYICLILIIFGLYKIFLSGAGTYYKQIIRNYMNEEQETDQLFLRTGMNIKTNQFTFILDVISLAIFIIFSIVSLASGNIGTLVAGIIIALALMVLLRPKKYILNDIRSPFIRLMERFTKKRSEELDSELYNSVIFLKNLSIAQEGHPLSADMMYDTLLHNSKKLKPVYQEMITRYRTGDTKGAFDYFTSSIGTRNARSFGLILQKIDLMDPIELKNQVSALQEIMAEERYTKGLENAQTKGTVIFTCATIVAFVLLINLVLVCVMMDAMTMLGDFM